MDGSNDLIQRHLTLDSQSALADEVGGTRPDDVHTKDLAELLAGDDLHKALAAVEDQSLAVGAHGELADLVL